MPICAKPTGENTWELRLGLDRVFWGVAELHNLVDVVNQLDLVEHPRDRHKLGQPMAHLTISGSWGVAETLLLPLSPQAHVSGAIGTPSDGPPGRRERRLRKRCRRAPRGFCVPLQPCRGSA